MTDNKTPDRKKFSITLANGREKFFDTGSDMSAWYEKKTYKKSRNKKKIKNKRKI
jgi:hypothetical protein|tara:strand:+ start:1216 stop:1380 length:165 start_codon:yes stop_codon:yes gene_type:complete